MANIESELFSPRFNEFLLAHIVWSDNGGPESGPHLTFDLEVPEWAWRAMDLCEGEEAVAYNRHVENYLVYVEED